MQVQGYLTAVGRKWNKVEIKGQKYVHMIQILHGQCSCMSSDFTRERNNVGYTWGRHQA